MSGEGLYAADPIVVVSSYTKKEVIYLQVIIYPWYYVCTIQREFFGRLTFQKGPFECRFWRFNFRKVGSV